MTVVALRIKTSNYNYGYEFNCFKAIFIKHNKCHLFFNTQDQ